MDKLRRYTEPCSYDEPVKLVKRYVERAQANTLGIGVTGCAQSLLALAALPEAARRQERSLLMVVVQGCCGTNNPDPTITRDEDVKKGCARFAEMKTWE